MEKDFSALEANDELCGYFASAIRASSLSHAYILLGPEGTGKHTLARQIAAAANCERADTGAIPCGECPSCRKILSDNSADVTWISREKDHATLGVDSVRFIKNDVALYPNDGNVKVYIIEDAHTMTPQAQNALLLTLEEPPPYVLFLLLSESSQSLLDTVKSRAPILRMRIPEKSEAKKYLSEHFPSVRAMINNSPEEFDELYMQSGGSMGKLLTLVGSPKKKAIMQSRQLTERIIEAISSSTLRNDFGQILAEMPSKRDDRERAIAQISELQSALRDLILLKKSDSPSLIFFSDAEHAEALSYSLSLARLIEITEICERAKLSLQRNANLKLTLTGFLGDLL